MKNADHPKKSAPMNQWLNSRMWSIWYPCSEALGGWPRNSLMSARLLILLQIFFGDFLMRLERHPTVAPNMKTERADSAEYRHHSSKKKPDRHGHVLSRFSIFCAVAKRTCQCLANWRKDRQEKQG